MAHDAQALPGLITRTDAELRQSFLRQTEAIPSGDRFKRCIQCGTCTGSCPVSYAMDISPRQLIALFREGEMETILKSRTIWICASCYACTTRCPEGIKITDLMYALKRTAMAGRRRSRAPQVQLLARLFVDNVKRYGRLHEGTLIRKFYMKTGITKLLGFIPLARKLWETGRLAPFPHRIRAYAELSRIITKAQEIEMRHVPHPLEYSPDFVGYKGLGGLKLESRKGD